MTKAELYQKACMLPLLPGVYIIRDKTDTIIYIGKAKRLRIRVSQYFREGVPHDNKVSQMIAHALSLIHISKLAKNRQGELVKVELSFDGARMTFSEVGGAGNFAQHHEATPFD